MAKTSPNAKNAAGTDLAINNTMNINLPRRKDADTPAQLSVAPGTSIVIIGANGAGKTRFTASMVGQLGEKAFRISALDGLYDRRKTIAGSQGLRGRCDATVVANLERGGTMPTGLELLLSQLMHEEMLNLISYKLSAANGSEAKLKRTKLDKVIDIWQDVFPDNKVLIDSGRILFSRGLDPENYSALKLSDGERAVLYYAGAVLFAPRNAVIFVDSPEMFLHPTLTSSLWNRLETLRRDCAFCYTTHDPDFASSRNGAPVLWVRDCDIEKEAWDYDIMPSQEGIASELYISLVGARKPVLFIEGDSHRSIDARLYPLIFPDYTVRSLGSCNKVIEATRTFNGLASFHRLDSTGIVDRDRRDDQEVNYLRSKNILVPEVAEIENMFLLEDVIRTMATINGTDAARAIEKVRHSVISLFKGELRQQALQHTRHYMKKMVERRVDGRFPDISTLEQHVGGLLEDLNPRGVYEQLCREFHNYIATNDYNGILKVYNQKSTLSNCNVAQLCGYSNKDRYIDGVISILSGIRPEAETLRKALRQALLVD